LNTVKVKIKKIELFERMVKLRMPFRFGVVTLTEAPQAFVKVTVENEDGRVEHGASAELMVPKWFDKSPDLSNEDNFNQLRLSLKRAKEAYLETGKSAETAFNIYANNYKNLVQTDKLNPLAASFGPAVIDKAILDALCRIKEVSFEQAIQENISGISLEVLAPDLKGFDTHSFLASLSQKTSIYARHTVGLLDPLIAADQESGTQVNDGLPETLEQVIDVYGHRYFKIKVGGNLKEDIARLLKISDVLDNSGIDYLVTLDGNEQYNDVNAALELWQALSTHKHLQAFTDRIILVEQPIHRSKALSMPIAKLAKHIPVIIDESDSTVDSFLQAKELGYTGVSSKTCKGLYKSIINAARCSMWNKELGEEKYFQSAEDLTCQAGLAVQQDLALISLLGITHVERNGHHYVNGLAGAEEQEQMDFLNTHNDLYQTTNGRTCIKIVDGKFSVASLQCIGFATSAFPDWSTLDDMQSN
jgi:hypothetical protein